MHKILPVINIFGKVLMAFSFCYLLPIIVSFIYEEDSRKYFIKAMFINASLGYLLWLTTRQFHRELKTRDGFLLVVSTWVGIAAFSTLPLMYVIPELSFTDAFFETMSGLTTTGATVLSGLDNLPKAVNFWRHELNWLGGMGILVLVVAILPLLGVGGMQLYKAETPGPMKDSKLTPRITETAKNLWLVYFGITLLCIISLRIAGMNWFDSVCHAFATMALGGFSTHDASVSFFNSVPIEIVLIIFMLIAALNFATHFLALRSRSFSVYKADIEGLMFLKVIFSSILAVALFLFLSGTYPSFWTALRHVAFNLVSIATDCGFMSVNYGDDKWPIAAPLWMLFLSCVAASSGSTGGGIKMIRTMILYKQGQREMVKLLHPAIIDPLKVGEQVIPNNVVFSVLGFIFLYFICVLSLTFLLMGSHLDFISSFTAIIACINNAGPGLGVVGPANNFGGLSDFQTWVCTLAMLLGRLEIFSLLIIFTPAFWRK
jgi:trk system potassium uptake protein TrkH